VIFGGAGGDLIMGRDGDDVIVGDHGVYNERADSVLLTDLDAGGNDVMIGGLGNDRMWGGPGSDIMLGGVGQVFRTLNADGSQRTDVLLLDEAYVVGSIPLEGQNVPLGDPATVNALVNADVTLLTGAYDADGTKHLNGDGSWDERAILLDLIGDGNDYISGGTGDDAIYGQRGNDTLRGDAGNDFVAGGTGNDSIDGGDGNDTLVGDDAFIDGTNPSVPNVTHGLLVVHTDASAEAAANISLGALGTTVVPMTSIVPGREVNAASWVLPHVFGYDAAIPANNSLQTSSGVRLVPYASVVTDFSHHVGLLHGNDTITGGNGNDTLVGDDLVVIAPAVTFDATTMAKAETITRGLLDLSCDFSDLVHRQYWLLGSPWDHGHDGPNDTIVVDHLYSIGEDVLDGGAGNDVLIGDDSTQIAPAFTLPVNLAEKFEFFQNGTADAGSEIGDAVLDLTYLEHRMRDRVIQVQQGWFKGSVVEHHVDMLMIGNDTIYGGDGNDLIVGDAFVLRAPSATLVPGGGSQYGERDWHYDEHWYDHGGNASWWQSWDFDRHHEYQLDFIEADADTIYGGAGDDLVWGDSIALITETIDRAPGISNFDFARASHEVAEGLDRLAALTDETDAWFEFAGRNHDHTHDSLTWVRTSDRDWERAHHHDRDDGDFISGGDGNDILFGQDGVDVIHGDAGNDWLIGGGGNWYDSLDGGPGYDRVYQGDNNSKSLRDAVSAAMPAWSGAFATLGLSIVPFSGNTTTTSGHPSLADFDYLTFNYSPWDGHSPVWQTAVGGVSSDGVATINDAQLAPIVAEAKQLWTQALGAGNSRLAVLDEVQVTAGNLPQDKLGVTVGTQIVIDSTAAGRGWFVDATPADNAEFALYVGTSELQAAPGSAAYGRMDLLTTVLHEMGNAMGFAEDQGPDVMSATLQAGVRDMPAGAAHVAAGATSSAASQGSAEGAFNPIAFDHWTALAVGTRSDGVGAVQSAAPTIDWSGTFGSDGTRRKTAPAADDAQWLGTFVNHLGQSEAHRNPNSAIRVQVTPRAEVLPETSLL